MSTPVYPEKDIYKNQKIAETLIKPRFPLQIKRARDGTRTRDPDLGKVVLHQLSHSRISLLYF